ncbi:DUF6350 family protein [uncultured Nocardioides sp.]|uniref:cell division protein PerM n=1 Tax=uncultured Nocardioides sp. TaxID=198441 RepID=UPI0026193FAD|nr:DUF6350 family protein [uncultured Nocardioides sp.]
MTSLLPTPGRTRDEGAAATGATPGATTPSGSGSWTASVPRPLTLVALLAGALAAATTLTVCLALGVLGWFLVDSGAHGTPGDGLRTAATAWLVAHGSAVTVQGSLVTLVPLGLTALAAWTTWRAAVRSGELLAGHGPDADRLGDGERDWTVPLASVLFSAGYVAVAVVTVVLAATPEAGPSTGRAVLGALALSLVVGAPGLAVGSGRAALWASQLPPAVPAAVAACGRLLVAVAVASVLTVLAAVVLAFDDVVNVFSRLHTGTGEAVALLVVCLAVLPNAAAYASSWLLGPGFAVGTQTLVSPGLVVVGPLPLFPLAGAVPAGGDPTPWSAAALGVLPLVAVWAVARTLRRHPTARWDEGAMRGCAAGLLAGLALGVLAWLAGGAVGPGRMTEIGPAPFAVLLHAVPSLGLGGLLGGVLATWRHRRATV